MQAAQQGRVPGAFTGWHERGAGVEYEDGHERWAFQAAHQGAASESFE